MKHSSKFMRFFETNLGIYIFRYRSLRKETDLGIYIFRYWSLTKEKHHVIFTCKYYDEKKISRKKYIYIPEKNVLQFRGLKDRISFPPRNETSFRIRNNMDKYSAV